MIRLVVNIDGVDYYRAREPNVEKMPICKILREERYRSGQTLQYVADKVNTCKSNLCEIESGKTEPKLLLGIRLLTHFGIHKSQVDCGD